MGGFRSSLEIVGTRSATCLDCTDQGFFVVEDQGTSGGDTHLWTEVNGPIAGDLADELDHFIKATLSGRSYQQDWREAFDAIPVLDALARSAETGIPVDVER
jgi:predicted dehydrogenase